MPTAHLHQLYSAALAASGDQAVAEQVSERAIVGARGGGDRAALVERAVLLAIRTAPHDALCRCARTSARSSRSHGSPARTRAASPPCSASSPVECAR